MNVDEELLDKRLFGCRNELLEEKFYELTDELINEIKNGKSEEILYKIGNNLEYGLNGFEKNMHKAYLFYLYSAECGFVKAQIRLGDLFADENEYDLSPKEVRDYMYESVLSWDLDRNNIGDGYSKRILFIEADERVEACRWYRMAAEQGNAEGQYLLSLTCGYEEHRKWLDLSASQGYLDALFTKFSSSSYTLEGLRCLVLAAEKGHTQAVRILSEPIQHPREKKNSPYNILARRYKRVIIDGKYNEAKKIGDDFFFGKNFEKDYKEAVKWYTIAASVGERNAMTMLGDCYYCGFGVDADIDKANQLYEQSREINYEDDTLYIYSGNIICIKDEHNIEQATALIFTLDGQEIKLNVNHCTRCKKFFVAYSVYESYRERYGVLLCKYKFIQNGTYEGACDTLEKRHERSELHSMGYNVSQRSNLSAYARQEIIRYCIESGTMSKREIINLLTGLIEYNGRKPNLSFAVEKWQEDRNFVLDYDIENQPEYIIRRIERYKRTLFKYK